MALFRIFVFDKNVFLQQEKKSKKLLPFNENKHYMSRTYRIGSFSSKEIVSGLRSGDTKESDIVLSYLHRLLYEKVKNTYCPTREVQRMQRTYFKKDFFLFTKVLKRKASPYQIMLKRTCLLFAEISG